MSYSATIKLEDYHDYQPLMLLTDDNDKSDNAWKRPGLVWTDPTDTAVEQLSAAV